MGIQLDGFDGVLPTTLAVIYTATGPEVLIGATFVNSSASAAVGSVYINRTGTSRPIIFEVSFSKGDSQSFPLRGESRHILLAGDTLEGVSTVASAIHYVVSVVRRT